MMVNSFNYIGVSMFFFERTFFALKFSIFLMFTLSRATNFVFLQ